MKKSFGQALAGLVFFSSMIAQAFAGSFSVSPVRVILTGDHPVIAMTVQNSEPEPTIVQLELVQWSQQEGKDIHLPTKDLLATPPIFTLPANGKQIIRIGLRKPLSQANELAYRIFLHEIPGPPKPNFQGLRVALKISVPIFIPPTSTPTHQLRWSAKVEKDNRLKISAVNVGNTHLQISNIKISTLNNLQVAMQGTSEYVLPMQKREWLFMLDHMPQDLLNLFVKTDAGDIQTQITLNKD